jgi:NAD(P)-dependent dehydrogenase (short-subunit alcohol dehydrogenase family)
MNQWTADAIPDQSGRIAIVTGANSGLGRGTTAELARKGARVILAVRDTTAGDRVAAEISRETPSARLEVRELDLASLASIAWFTHEVADAEEQIDLLVNNAGVMRTPKQRTEDGFERQLGTNYLGHFALTGRLLPLLQRAPTARVVTVSSTEHKPGIIHLDDLQLDRDYAPRKAYQQSKLANTMFAIELDRRLRAAGSTVISVLAHPGVSATNLATTGPTGLSGVFVRVTSRILAQPASRGALPQLYAATAPGVQGGQFFGPRGPGEMRGPVTEVMPSDRARDIATAQRLWALSEELTHVTFGLLPVSDAAGG